MCLRVQGICNTPPPTLDHPDALAEGSMFCVIEVLHSWLQVEPGSGPIETVISNLFVHSVRDGRDGRDPCMLDFQSAAEGSSVWLQGLALQGDASPVRGVCAPTCDISAAGVRPALRCCIVFCTRYTRCFVGGHCGLRTLYL